MPEGHPLVEDNQSSRSGLQLLSGVLFFLGTLSGLMTLDVLFLIGSAVIDRTSGDWATNSWACPSGWSSPWDCGH